MISKQQLEAYQNDGYLIIPGTIQASRLDQLYEAYRRLRAELADLCGVKFEDYIREISQLRDLWRFSSEFERFLFSEEIAKLAPQFFCSGECRLLHDHIINKPLDNNSIVPWHQDYAYWPVDNAEGLSFWIGFTDLDESAGVLEVVPGSHLWGEDAPVDFMNDGRKYECFEALAVRKGDIVVLNALTWHRTTENTSVDERVAYITLFISSTARYAPNHANWHPVNEHVTVEPGEELNSDWFPTFGSMNTNIPPATPVCRDNSALENEKLSMFNASKVVSRFLNSRIDVPSNASLWSLLYTDETRAFAVQSLAHEFDLGESQRSELDAALKSLAINSLAYTSHRARNVYNSSYAELRKLFGDELFTQ